jgi:hypothetical protein
LNPAPQSLFWVQRQAPLVQVKAVPLLPLQSEACEQPRKQ